MTSQDDREVVCPESTLESANRRNFVRKAALASAAIGVGSTLFARNALPKSSARSDCCQVVGTTCAACIPAGAFTAYGNYASGVYAVANGPCAAAVGAHANGSGKTIGVNGISTSTDGHGVNGIATAAGGVGVRGVACNNCAIPIVARGTSSQKADLQHWQKGCTVESVVNSCGWFGIGTTTPSTSLDVIGSVFATCTRCAICSPGLAIEGKATGVLGIGVNGISNGGCGVGVKGSSSGECGYGVTGCASGSGCGSGVHGVSSTKGGAGVCGFGTSTCGVNFGVRGYTLSSRGHGVCGTAISAGAVGIRGTANGPCVTPIVARGYSCQVANLQHWQRGCTIKSVVNSCGWFGIGTCKPTVPLDVIGGANVACVLTVSGNANIVSDSPLLTPLVVAGAPSQEANLQEWENGCRTITAVINAAGSLGLGGVVKPHHVLCISGIAHASKGFSIGPCVCVNTTLAVNGSLAAKTRTVGSTTTLLTTDYAILATGTITLTLPPAKTQNGMMIFIKNTSTSTVSVVPGGTDSIEGSSTARTLTKQYDSLTLISNGSNEWFIQSGVSGGVVIS